MCIFWHRIKKYHNSWHPSANTSDISFYIAPSTGPSCEDLPTSEFLESQCKSDLSKTKAPNTVCLYDLSNFFGVLLLIFLTSAFQVSFVLFWLILKAFLWQHYVSNKQRFAPSLSIFFFFCFFVQNLQ